MGTRAADDFSTIKARLEELRKQENIRSTPESTQEPVNVIPTQTGGTGSDQVQDELPCYMQDYVAHNPVTQEEIEEFYRQIHPPIIVSDEKLKEAQRKIQEFYKQAQVTTKEMSIGYTVQRSKGRTIIRYNNQHYYSPHNLDVKD